MDNAESYAIVAGTKRNDKPGSLNEIGDGDIPVAGFAE